MYTFDLPRLSLSKRNSLKSNEVYWLLHWPVHISFYLGKEKNSELGLFTVEFCFLWDQPLLSNLDKVFGEAGTGPGPIFTNV